MDTGFYSGSGLDAWLGRARYLPAHSVQVVQSRKGIMGHYGCLWSTTQTQPGLLLPFRAYQEAMP